MLGLFRLAVDTPPQLDPTFEYEPHLPPQPAGPAHDQLLQDRYRVLWDCSVDARLAQRGLLPAVLKSERLPAFARAFACLGSNVEGYFDCVVDAPRPSHRTMVEMTEDPESFFGRRQGPAPPARRCPLCAFPTVEFEPAVETLSTAVLSVIRIEFPRWRVDDGLCRQCADLYRARRLSDEACERLPVAVGDRRPGTGGSTG